MTDVVRTCTRTWRRLGVPRAARAELAAELEADLAAAAEDGVTPEQLVGGDARAFAFEWAAARGLVRPRPRLAATVLAALVGAVPGVALALFAAYGMSSTEFAELVGADVVRVGEGTYAADFEPPPWLYLSLYVAGGVFAVAGAVAAVGAVLQARGDEAAGRTVRRALLVLPLAAVAAVLATMGFAWTQSFSTAGAVVLAEGALAAGVFALGVSAVRLTAVYSAESSSG